MEIPDTIYMQHDCDGDLSTWCADRVNDSDTVYVHAEALAEARAAERARCLAIIQQYIGYDEAGLVAADIYDVVAEE